MSATSDKMHDLDTSPSATGVVASDGPADDTAIEFDDDGARVEVEGAEQLLDGRTASKVRESPLMISRLIMRSPPTA